MTIIVIKRVVITIMTPTNNNNDNNNNHSNDNDNNNNNDNNNKIECKKKHIMELHTYFDKPTVKMFDYKILDG